MTNADITLIITTFIQQLPAILTASAPVISALAGLVATILATRRMSQKQDKLPPSYDA